MHQGVTLLQSDIYNVCFPLVRKKVRRVDLLKPWLCDDAFLSKVREKHLLYSRHLKGSLNQTDTDRLKDLTSQVNRLRKDLKRSFFSRRLAEAEKNSKRAWKVIHEFIEKPGKSGISCPTFAHNGGSLTDDGEIAEGFCRFFTDIGPDLADKVRVPHGKTYMDYLGNGSGDSMFMMPTTPGEIESYCLGLDHSKGPGYDDFSPDVIKDAATGISVPLSRLVNTCLERGHFPDFLKIARIKPVFKADSLW
jgi:hypothetical protein